MTKLLPNRDDVVADLTWDLRPMFADQLAWDAAYAEAEGRLPELAAFAGRLADSGATLLTLIRTSEQLGSAITRVFSYAAQSFDVDTTNQVAGARRNRGFSLFARYLAATSFINPELITISPERLAALIAEEPQLVPYRHFLQNVQRLAPHTRSAEVEQVLALSAEALEGPWSTYQALVEADLRFADAIDSNAAPYPVSRSTIDDLLASPDRTLRLNAWASYADGFLLLKNALSANYMSQVRGSVFNARVRGYGSALEAALAPANLPVAVYENIIGACQAGLPIWHRYWEIRRRALGLEQMSAADIFAPLARPTKVSYEQAVEWICAGMAPLGEEYVRISREGLLEQRWVDRSANRGKIGGAYSSGSYGTPPYILMSYGDDISSMSTLAHELGHSMHTWYTNQHQPFLYSNYSMFVAEVASNFNQALVRAELLRRDLDRETRIGLLEEAIANFHRYFFVMPTLARFELEAHRTVEAGGSLTADGLMAQLSAIWREAYGPAVSVDPARDGIVWAQFSHLYVNFYVFQYASGIAAANALAAEIANGNRAAVARYQHFLAAGSSGYPLDVLAEAGIDMRSPEPMQRAFAVLEGYIAELESLLTS